MAMDTGFGFTKAVREDGRRVCFPSAVMARSGSGALSGVIGGGGAGYGVRLEQYGETRRVLVGEAALGLGAVRSWDTQAAARTDYEVLTLSALALLGVQGACSLAVGLPLGLYAVTGDRTALRDRLEGLEAKVTVEGREPVSVAVGRVTVLPQAAGAYYAALLVDRSIGTRPCGVLDIGFRTSDALLMLPVGRSAQPDEMRSVSFDQGIGGTFEAVARAVSEETGTMIPAGAVERAANGDGRLAVRGREVDVAERLAVVQRELAEGIAAQLRRLWGADLDLLGALVVAGGGGRALLSHLRGLTPAVRLASEPLYANAEGFLALLGSRSAQTAAR